MNLQDMLLHAQTRQALEQLISGNAHAAILAAPSGAGKQTLARAVAAHLLGLESDRLDLAPYYRQVAPETSIITIEQVRQLQQFLRLRTTGTAAIRRVVVLLGADTMNAEAQNALLKTLEEPPADTVLLLTADDAEQLLPTVRSRARIIRVLAPSQQQATEYFTAKGISAEALAKAYAISGGGTGLLCDLTKGESAADTVAAIDQAKQLLGQGTFDRLVQVDTLAKDKDHLPVLIIALKRICRGALQQAAEKGNAVAVKAWHKRLTAVTEAESMLAKSTNAKLLLTDLFLHL